MKWLYISITIKQIDDFGNLNLVHIISTVCAIQHRFWNLVSQFLPSDRKETSNPWGICICGCVGNYIFSTRQHLLSNMGTFHLFGGLLLVAGILVLQTAAQDEPQVTIPGTPSTTLRGNYYHFNETEYLNVDIIIEEFLGIPFAKPPEGDLRFRKPVLPNPLGSTYNAKRDKPMCAQLTSVISPDEDCLYLGVFTSSPRVRS